MSRFDPDLFRVYEPDECGNDGYPLNWHRVVGCAGGVKDMARASWGMRCERCRHPYTKGAGEWSSCDEQCTHGGPLRVMSTEGWRDFDPRSPASVPALRSDWPDAPVQAAWRILTVHHLQLGYDAKRDLRWWNLAVLCQRCHLQIQGKVQMARIWPWPHTPWFQPHAAGWYAWTYEQREISYEEAIERLSELLAYERQAA